jgi:hypothetical protein
VFCNEASKRVGFGGAGPDGKKVCKMGKRRRRIVRA